MLHFKFSFSDAVTAKSLLQLYSIANYLVKSVHLQKKLVFSSVIYLALPYAELSFNSKSLYIWSKFTISYVVAVTGVVLDLLLQMHKISNTPSEHETNIMEMLIPTAIGNGLSVEDWQVAGK